MQQHHYTVGTIRMSKYTYLVFLFCCCLLRQGLLFFRKGIRQHTSWVNVTALIVYLPLCICMGLTTVIPWKNVPAKRMQPNGVYGVIYVLGWYYHVSV